MSSLKLFVIFSTLLIGSNGKLKKNHPPHCTTVTKNTDYISKFKFDYPTAYIIPGQHEAYQQMYCINPSAVHTAATTVCDWAAPPQVQFTLGDEYMHVVRQDPSGRFLGNAVITTYQLCSHNITHVEEHKQMLPAITQIAISQVQFTLGDEYMHVVRQDPSGRFLGNAVITTYQICSHNITHDEENKQMLPGIT